MAEKVKLPKGVTVYQGGRSFSGEIAAENCPQKLRKQPTTSKPTPTDTKEK